MKQKQYYNKHNIDGFIVYHWYFSLISSLGSSENPKCTSYELQFLVEFLFFHKFEVRTIRFLKLFLFRFNSLCKCNIQCLNYNKKKIGIMLHLSLMYTKEAHELHIFFFIHKRKRLLHNKHT